MYQTAVAPATARRRTNAAMTVTARRRRLLSGGVASSNADGVFKTAEAGSNADERRTGGAGMSFQANSRGPSAPVGTSPDGSSGGSSGAFSASLRIAESSLDRV